MQNSVSYMSVEHAPKKLDSLSTQKYISSVESRKEKKNRREYLFKNFVPKLF